MTLSTAYTSAKAADAAKLLLLNKCRVTHPPMRSMMPLPANGNPNPNVTRPGLTPKSNGFFGCQCAPPPLHQIVRKSVEQFLRNPVDKQTNKVKVL